MGERINLAISRHSDIVRTPRVMQAEGIFDVPPSQRSGETWDVDFTLPDIWNIGVIVGPSGCGKSTIAREAWGQFMAGEYSWPDDKSLLDGFPGEMGIKDITALLSSVGFSSPPSWVRPFGVLSNGEQFRVSMARTLAELKELAVVDEFTSVVDRTVAQIGSAAIAKTVRKRSQNLIAVTCHYDVLEWLEPDWVYQPASGEFISGRCLQRSEIELEVRRVHSSAWEMFRKHHYLNTSIRPNARCFVAFWRGVPVAFTSYLHFPHPKVNDIYMGHRTVCLPDFQGVGIGIAMGDLMASCIKAMGKRCRRTTGNPAMVHAWSKSKSWRMVSAPQVNRTGGKDRISRKKAIAWNRLTASFEYVGPAADVETARKLWDGV